MKSSRNSPREGGRSVLFVCLENAARSLMAEAMFNAHAPEGWRATSAGTKPATSPNPRTAGMLREIGLELPTHAPQLLTIEMVESAEVYVTMGCLDDASCPAFLRKADVRDWRLPNPADLGDGDFREVRDRLVGLVAALRQELRARGPEAWGSSPSSAK